MKRIVSLLLTAIILAGALITSAPPAEAAGKKLVAITYDDGPGPYTDRLLDGLKARGTKATFFMVGNRVSSYSSTVARVYREGHQVANHSYDHSDLTGLSWSGVRNQIQSTNSQLDKACGNGTSYLVRAPYGSVNSTVLGAVGAPLVLWSVDPADWLYRNAETVKNNIIRNAHDGAVILVHDIHSTSIPGSLAAIDYLQGQGYEFVTVNELFRRRGKSMSSGVQYNSCGNTGKDLGPVSAPTVTTETVDGKLQVTIKAQAGASIYYTTGSGELNQESTKYTGPFLTNYPCRLRTAAAFNMNGGRSETVELTFTKPKVRKPRIQVAEGMLSIECDTEGAEIYYSLTGASESGGEQFYTGPVPIEPGTEISAYGALEGCLDSDVESAAYTSRGNLFYSSDMRPGQWFYEDMDRAAAAGYINGVGGGMFAPNKEVTRGQLVTILYRYSGETAGEETLEHLPFSDVEPDKYYTEPVAWAYGNGIVNGFKDNTFKPGRGITRQEMAQIFYNFLEYKQAAPGPAEEYIKNYTDADKIQSWAAGAIGGVSYIGLMQGDGKGAFQPTGSTTRAQAAKVLISMADHLESLQELPAEDEAVT